jgi:hypothetical protein
MTRYVSLSVRLIGATALLVLPVFYADGQVAVLRSNPPTTPLPASQIVESFIRAETQVREAMNQRTFRREVVLQTLGPNGEVTGEYLRNSQFLFDDSGKRIERVTFHPRSTIREMKITKEDLLDLAGAQLLGLDIAEASKYRLGFVGEEVLNARRVYQLSAEPLSKPNPKKMSERFFRGLVWIDAATFQIVKVKGVVEPQGKQRFPVFETWREPVSDSLRLPTRTEADDVLRFPDANVNYRIRVKYYDYKLFASRLTVTEIDDPDNQ